LTALGDEDSSSASNNMLTADLGAATAEPPSSSTKKKQKRYLPNHKKPDAAVTFPEKVSQFRLPTWWREKIFVGDVDPCLLGDVDIFTAEVMGFDKIQG
jgi:hypothetical protein